MKVKISDLIDYEQPDDKEPVWFLNLRSGNVENVDEIISAIDVSKNYFYTYAYDYDYSALPYVDTDEICRKFIVQLNNKALTDYLKRLPHETAVNEFLRLFHPMASIESEHWADFEFEEKKKAVISWCEENNIQFILDV